jgi:hypothetical protein
MLNVLLSHFRYNILNVCVFLCVCVCVCEREREREREKERDRERGRKNHPSHFSV